MAEIFNRKLSDDAIEFWVEELAPRYDKHTQEAINAGCREARMPAINWVLERASNRRHEESQLREMQERSEERRKEQAEKEALPEDERLARDRAADEFFARMREKLGY